LPPEKDPDLAGILRRFQEVIGRHSSRGFQIAGNIKMVREP
jgi:hypothetical protein